MSGLRLQRVLNRFKSIDYEFLRTKWYPLDQAIRSSEDFSVAQLHKMNKKDFHDFVVKTIRKRVWKHSLDLLELLYILRYSHSRKWHVVKLTRTSEAVRDASRVEEDLTERLSLTLPAEVRVVVDADLMWMRVQPYTDQSLPSGPPLYYIYHETTSVILANNMKTRLTDIIMQSLLTCLGCSQPVRLELEGKHVESLLQLVLKKHQQESGDRLSLSAADRKRLRGRKRKERDEGELDERITNENTDKRKRRQQVTRDTYGNTVLPSLENLEYTLETPFTGFHNAPTMRQHQDMPFHCKLSFKGSNVLEGIRGLGLAGVVSLPMKDHLATVHTRARSSVVLKKRAQTSMVHTPHRPGHRRLTAF